MKNTLNMEPYVSVVMTSYNRDKYIGKAIDSVLAQECKFSFEIIIGDDCSIDTSRALLVSYQQKFPQIIKLNFQKNNLGLGGNWASCCKLARGKYVAFLDDDDYYCDVHRLQAMVDFMDTHAEYGLIHTNFYRLYLKTKKMVPENAKDPTGTDALTGLYKGTYPLCFGTCMIRRELICAKIPLDDYITMKFPIQDWPTCMLLAPHTKFKYIDSPSYVYRIHDGSMSRPQTYEHVINKYAAEKNMYEFVMKQVNIAFDEEGWDSYVNNILLSLAYKRHDYQRAKEYAANTRDMSLKEKCTHNRSSFYALCTLYSIRKLFKRISK